MEVPISELQLDEETSQAVVPGPDPAGEGAMATDDGPAAADPASLTPRQIVAELDPQEVTPEVLGAYMTGLGEVEAD